MRPLHRETDIDILRTKAMLLERENQRLVRAMCELQQRLLKLEGKEPEQLLMELARLEEELAAHRRHQFGKSSEKQKPADKPAEKAEPTAPSGHGRNAQPNLPHLEDIHENDTADNICPHCGGALCAWDGQFEEYEEVDVIARQFVVRKHKRRKYKCGCGHIETALAPPRLMKGARYSIDFAVQVAIDKYVDHLPLRRQTRIMARLGLEVSAQTLFDLLWAMYEELAGLQERAWGAVLCAEVVHADETRWRMLMPLPAPWHIWTLCSDEVVVFFFRDGRRHEIAKEILPDIGTLVDESHRLPAPVGAERLRRNDERTLLSDDYGAYAALAKARPGLRHALCWAHARRKFEELKGVYPEVVATALEMIAALYGLEREVPRGREHDGERTRMRHERAQPVLENIFAWASAQHALPGSKLGEALNYLRSNRAALSVFLGDPRVPLDNNLGERVERGPVVGRKNHYGSKSNRGIRVAELMYTLIESAKLADVEPAAYLKAAISDAVEKRPLRLPHEMRDRLPRYRRQRPQGTGPPRTPEIHVSV